MIRGNRAAFGSPGIEPRWTAGSKDGVGTAYSHSSRAWFTIWRGIITEVYFPTVDRPQLRDLQFLITDGKTFLHEEKRHLQSTIEQLTEHALGYKIVNSDPEGRYSITKEIITDPHLACVLQHTKIEGDPAFINGLKLYALCAPHLEVGGAHNNGYVMHVAGRDVLMAEKEGTWLALGANIPFTRLSCGYVGSSDGWTDLHEGFAMDWEFDEAKDGNISLTGEFLVANGGEFTLGLAFGDSLHHAISTLLQALGIPFEVQKGRYVEQWDRAGNTLLPMEWDKEGDGILYRRSNSVILAHEDKIYPGAFIASLSIPWGEEKGDEDMGGYHLVWTRDLVHGVTALLAAGDKERPLRSLIFLAASQREDGGFSQNFWIEGEQFWEGVQLDEVAFPILLACHLDREKSLGEFDPYSMVLRAASFLIRRGPVTGEDRWEECGGFSPSTLAAVIAALVGASACAAARGEDTTARYLLDYADFLECHIEEWTVTTEGTLVPGIPRHYIRIRPALLSDLSPDEDPNEGMLTLANTEPGKQFEFPSKEIVDAGFLELVRYGIRAADDPTILDSVRVIDAVLREEVDAGNGVTYPAWHRYNHDGYGQHSDGTGYNGWGKGRLWPLLTGERAHYELARGEDVTRYIEAMEWFATETGLFPEQVWDEEDRPDIHMLHGRPTGSATPLMWVHAEYIKLLRSQRSGKVFDLVPEVKKRYITDRTHEALEIWQPTRQVKSVRAGRRLRIQANSAFQLHWSLDNWKTRNDSSSISTPLSVEYADAPAGVRQGSTFIFTFFWPGENRWEGKDYSIEVR